MQRMLYHGIIKTFSASATSFSFASTLPPPPPRSPPSSAPYFFLRQLQFSPSLSSQVQRNGFGSIVATWYDVRLEKRVAVQGLIRTLKMTGNYGATFAAIGGVYIGVEQLVQHYRSKRDFVNGAVGGFVAGATILGYKGRSIPTTLSAGAALVVTSALIDAGGQITRHDTGKEYYPYTTKKRSKSSVAA